jgi:hypothetical protein
MLVSARFPTLPFKSMPVLGWFGVWPGFVTDRLIWHSVPAVCDFADMVDGSSCFFLHDLEKSLVKIKRYALGI